MALSFHPADVDSAGEFVSHWAERYHDPREGLYTESIGKPFTPERIHALFVWKNGGVLSARKHRSVEENYIQRVEEVRRLPPETSAKEFLARFSSGGAIWRIFWLHCWQPRRFPIYDQHAHRAMAVLESGEREDITKKSDRWKVEAYIERYLPFQNHFARFDLREVDRALWAFGKAVKNQRP